MNTEVLHQCVFHKKIRMNMKGFTSNIIYYNRSFLMLLFRQNIVQFLPLSFFQH
jgi:hypothetical protein